MEKKILNEINRTLELMGINSKLLNESWVYYIDELVDLFKNVKTYKVGTGFNAPIKATVAGIEIFEKELNDLITKLSRRDINNLTEQEINIITKSIDENENLFANVYNSAVYEIQSNGQNLDDLYDIINSAKLTQTDIYNDLVTKFGLDIITAKVVAKEIKKAADEIAISGNILPKLQKIAKNSTYWQGVMSKCNMDFIEFVSYWRYSPFNKLFQNSVQEWARGSKLFGGDILSRQEEFCDYMMGFFSSVVDESKKIGRGKNIIKEYQTEFNKLNAQLDTLIKREGGYFDKSLYIEELIKVFKSNPEFEKLDDLTKTTLETSVRKALDEFDPKSKNYPGWFAFMFDDTNSLRNFFKALFTKGENTYVLERLKNYLTKGFMKSDEEWHNLSVELNRPILKVYQVAGKGTQIQLGKLTYLWLMTKFVIPASLGIVWGLIKILLAIGIPYFRDPEWETGQGYAGKIKEFLQYFVREIRNQIKYTCTEIRGIGGNPYEIDSAGDYALTFLMNLIPYDVKFEDFIQISDDIQSGEYQRRANELINNYEQRLRSNGYSEEEIEVMRQRAIEVIRQEGIEMDSIPEIPNIPEIDSTLLRPQEGPVESAPSDNRVDIINLYNDNNPNDKVTNYNPQTNTATYQGKNGTITQSGNGDLIFLSSDYKTSKNFGKINER